VTTFKRFTRGVAVLASTLGTNASAQRTAGALPPVPAVHGALRITVAHPAAGSAIDFGDSTFIFGTVGDGSAMLTVAGQPVAVAPNGAWLAWVAFPHDSAPSVTLIARRGQDSARMVLRLVRSDWVRQSGAWFDAHSFVPVGNFWMPAGEPLPLTVRAAPGASVRLLLPGGEIVRFTADSIADAPPAGIRAFDRDDRNLLRVPVGDRYVATLQSEINAAASTADPLNSARAIPPGPTLEIALGSDTTRIPWPLAVTRSSQLPFAVVLHDAPPLTGHADPLTIGRTFLTGTYTWFLPPGTRTRADMVANDAVRLRMSRDAIAWVPLNDVHRAAAPDDVRHAIMGSPTLTADSSGAELRIPLTRPVPHSVDESERGLTITLFNAVSDANWTRYGADQRFVQLLTWKQDAEDRVVLNVTFDRPLWGWRVRVDGTDLVFDFRAPPAVDLDHPLKGRRIVVDAGHPPGGACGPTGLCEPEANLNIANIVRDQLVAAGAIVIMTRTTPQDVGLWPRVALADSVSAELLVAIHNNALPDGVNPLTNNGTSTFFNHPHSLALARAVQSRLVANLGLRDLGVTRAHTTNLVSGDSDGGTVSDGSRAGGDAADGGRSAAICHRRGGRDHRVPSWCCPAIASRAVDDATHEIGECRGHAAAQLAATDERADRGPGAPGHWYFGGAYRRDRPVGRGAPANPLDAGAGGARHLPAASGDPGRDHGECAWYVFRVPPLRPDR
jgi:N-acetylmuramoyl-L-alanine amidase